MPLEFQRSLAGSPGDNRQSAEPTPVPTADPYPKLPIEDAALSEGYTKKTENFDSEPQWINSNNRTRFAEGGCKQVQQNYGYGSGQAGGTFVRSIRPGYYADNIGKVTFKKKLTATGKIILRGVDDGSFHLGWFNSKMQGWRPVSSIALRYDGRSSGVANVRLDYSTSTWNVGGLDTPIDVNPDGSVHTFQMIYDPDANGGGGAVTLSMDGGPVQTLNFEPGHKALGAEMDRFGMFHNQRQQASTIEAYFDDLTYSVESGTREQSFSNDPNWVGRNNRLSFEDCELLDNNNYGFTNTNYAGLGRGELGGLFWRGSEALDQRIYYADQVGPFELSDYLEASGMVSFVRSSVDSGMLIGFFDENTNVGQVQQGNFVGIYIEGPSRIGHYFCRYALSGTTAVANGCEDSPVIRPDGRRLPWRFVYNPQAFNGNGGIALSLDGKVTTYPLPAGFKNTAARFTRFGVQTVRGSGNSMRIYFDDLNYTKAEAVSAGDERQRPLPRLSPSAEFIDFIENGQWLGR